MRVWLLIFNVLFIALLAPRFGLAEVRLQDLEFSRVAQRVEMPSRLQKLTDEFSRHWIGHGNDEFSRMMWTPGARKVAIWFPAWKLKEAKSPLTILQAGSGIVIAYPDGGVFFCRGCKVSEVSAAEVSPAYHARTTISKLFLPEASAQACAQANNPLGQIAGEIGVSNVMDALKTCNWSITDMLAEAYRAAGNAAANLISGKFIEDLAKIPAGIERLVTDFSTEILPAIQNLVRLFPELWDALVCQFAQDGVRNVIFAAVIPGAGTTAAVARIAVNMEEFRAKVTQLLHSSGKFIELLRGLKERGNGKISRPHAAAIAALQFDLPFSPTRWAGNRTLQAHFDRHKTNVSRASVADYERASLEFGRKKTPTTMVTKTKDGGWVKYDADSRELLVTNRQGEILSYYRADRGTSTERFASFLEGRIAPPSP